MPRPAKPQDQSTFHGRVGAVIRRRRLKRQLSAGEAATAAGVPRATWYHWESGRHLALERLPAIADALWCEERDLIPRREKE